MARIEEQRVADWNNQKLVQFKKLEDQMYATNMDTLQVHEERRN